MTETFARVDGALRHRFPEERWARLLDPEDPRGTERRAALPDWAHPLDPREEDAPGPVEVDPALEEALTGAAQAALTMEVVVQAGPRGVLGAVWTDGQVGVAVVRGLDVREQGGGTAVRRRPGVEVSTFGVAQLLDEVTRLVPPASQRSGPALPLDRPAEPAGEASRASAAPATPDVDVPTELAVALVTARRTGDRAVLEALLADLGAAEMPPVLAALAEPLSGSLTVTVRSAGRPDVSVLSWVRCSLGWVEMVPLPGGILRHRVVEVEDLARRLLPELTTRLSAAAAGDGESS